MVRAAFGIVSIVALTAGATLAVQAQSLAIPAEFPPTSFRGTQYVDSQGCAFVRAGQGILVNWVPRVDRQRNQLCGFQQTQIAAQAGSIAANGPIILFDDIPVATPAAVAAPRVAPVVEAPIVATRVVEPVATPEPPRITFAEVCDGNFGIQTGFATANGDPINCGPAPVAPAVAASVVAPLPLPEPLLAAVVPTSAPVIQPVAPRMTFAEACAGRFGVQAGFVSGTTGLPIDCGPAPALVAALASQPVVEAGPRRVTRIEICAEIAATGRTFIDAATGSPVACATAVAPTFVASVATNAGPVAPGAPVAAFVPRTPAVQAPVALASSGSCPGVSSISAQYLVGTADNPVRCGPQTVSPSGTAFTTRATAPLPFASPPVPASNPAPAAVRAQAIRPPIGYTQVWTDGRINPNRGVRRITREQAIAEGLIAAPAAPLTARVSSRNVAPAAVRAPAAAATKHRFVQVGSFGDHNNANRLADQFQARGWPVTFANTSRNGTAIKIVILGPFAQPAQLRTGLQAARAAGFGDAFTRN
jgi:hypothetical protein